MFFTRRLAPLVGLMFTFGAFAQAQNTGSGSYTQAVEKVSSSGTEAPRPQRPKSRSRKTTRPSLDLGAESGKNYTIKKTFTGPVKKATLQLTCDNGFVASSTERGRQGERVGSIDEGRHHTACRRR